MLNWSYIYTMNKGTFEQLYSSEAFEKSAATIIAVLSAHLKSVSSGEHTKTIDWNTPEAELTFWKRYLEEGDVNDFIPEILDHTIHTHNPKYVGHQVAAPAPITALTSMVSGLLNNGMAVYEMGMAPSAIERIVTDSVCQAIGYNDDAGGFLTSGGSLANLTALLSARKAKCSYDVWREGYLKPMGIMVCEESHYCVDRAAKIMGLGEKGIIKVPALPNFSMDVNQLPKLYEAASAKGIEIFAVIGSAPSTATGAHDDLEAIAQFAEEKKLWFHIDGAHGGAAIYSSKYRYLVKGIERADSVTIDGHKMLLMPTITTALLFKNKQHAQHTFNQKADYLLNDSHEDWFNSGKKTFECTKTMMSLHWFILLKVYGEGLFDAFVTRQYDLTRGFANLIDQQQHFELAVAPTSNIVCFRYVEDTFSEQELNELNAQIRQHLLEDGEYYLVQTKLKGKHYLRTTLMNPFTTLTHLKALLEKIEATVVHIAQ